MSRQPRKVFGFTGGAKYGPVAEGEEGDPAAGAAGAPKAADMDRKPSENKKEEDSCWSDFTEYCCPENRRGV